MSQTCKNQFEKIALHGYVLAKDCNISLLLAEVFIDQSTPSACSDTDPDGVEPQADQGT